MSEGHEGTRQGDIRVVIDDQGVITDIGGGWAQAAEQGGAADALAVDRVIGRPLARFVGSDATRMYYNAVFKLARLRRQSLTREYRCDSPTHKRFMEVTVTPLSDGGIEMLHQLLHEEPFEHAFTPMPVTRPDARLGTAVRCSICNRIRLAGTQEWVEPERLVEQQARTLSVVHSVCPDCKQHDWFGVRRGVGMRD
ncbi:MAG: hypothetical protein ACOC00_08505 [Halothiobacillaceae bacterium]